MIKALHKGMLEKLKPYPSHLTIAGQFPPKLSKITEYSF